MLASCYWHLRWISLIFLGLYPLELLDEGWILEAEGPELLCEVRLVLAGCWRLLLDHRRLDLDMMMAHH